MFELWGFGEWFLSIWFICYIITYIRILINDPDIDKVIGYSILCGLFWPFIWIYAFINRDK